jgi:histidine triad (HIT) family protein
MCIFCKIVEGAIPSNKEYEDENCIAFHDINPIAPVHILVIPKKHIESFNDVDPQTMGEITIAIQAVTAKMGLDSSGYRIINNIGHHGGQEVPHIHFHIVGGQRLPWKSLTDDPHASL